MPWDAMVPLSLVVAGVASLVIFGLGVRVSLQRRTRPYLLVTTALGALVARSAVGAGDLLGLLTHSQHHSVEHTLDMVIAVCLLGAVIGMGRPTNPERTIDE